MGVFLGLKIFPDRIHPDDWGDFYDDSLRLLVSFSEPLISPNRRIIQGFECVSYSHDIERDLDDPMSRHWHVSGSMRDISVMEAAKDQQYLATAQSFRMFRALQRYRSPGEGSKAAGIVDAVDDEAGEAESCLVFFAKTQGLAFHIPLLAVAMLAEHRFPDCAITFGDIDASQADQSQSIVFRHLGERIPHPLLTDSSRLLEKVLGRQGDINGLEQFIRVYSPPREAASQLLKTLVDHNQWGLAREWFLKHFRVLSPGSIGAGKCCLSWIQATSDLKELFVMTCKSPAGPQFKPEDVLKSLAEAGIGSTDEEMRWVVEANQRLENADSLSALMVRRVLSQSSFATDPRPPVVEVGALKDALVTVFGTAEGERLMVRFEEHKRAFLDALTALEGSIDSIMDESDGSLAEELSYEEEFKRDEDILGIFAQSLHPAWCSVKESTDEQARSSGGSVVSVTRRLLFRECASRHLPLTETAWDWIENEQDRDVLTLLLTLVLVKNPEIHFCAVRDCVMNNRHRCQILVSALKALSSSDS